MLLPSFQSELIEAGCDEAGRGCLAGPVCAAAVILPSDFQNELLNDSKKLKVNDRNELRKIIEKEATSWAVAMVDHEEIDRINILWASIKAMHLALDQLKIIPGFISIDGNRFKPWKDVPFQTVVKGDGKFMNIAAASVLAKTHRDEYMENLHFEHPEYDWIQNKGYPTPKHIAAIGKIGYSDHHRKSFKLKSKQLSLWPANS
ncbi:MAG: ribonuclease HII [Bacteroidetes bacterium]|nr:ribonuclease HII [Bacteroidota bacterium]